MKAIINRKFYLFALSFIFLNTYSQTQSEPYVITKKMNFNKVMSFKKPHGIKVNTSLSNWSVNLTVKTKYNVYIDGYEGCSESNWILTNFDDQLLIYAADADQDTPNHQGSDYKHERNVTNQYFDFSFLNYPCYRNDYADGKLFYSANAYWAKYKKANYTSTSNWFSSANIHGDVEIILTLSDGLELSNIESIKIPGITAFSGEDFKDDFNPNSFAFLGNYGCASKPKTQDVANFIQNNLNPDVIISAGNDSYHSYDNNCGSNFNNNVGALYTSYLPNKFKSVLGTTDYINSSGIHKGLIGENNWKSFFNHSNPYYKVSYNNIDFFMINTNYRYSPDTNPFNQTSLNQMEAWLINELNASEAQYKIVVGHHEVLGSGQAQTPIHNWNFKQMGADMYISSGGYHYERLDLYGIPHVNVGLGGYNKIHQNPSQYPEPMVNNTHYDEDFGVLKATRGGNNLSFEFFSVTGEKIDEFYIFGYEKDHDANNYYLEKFRGAPIASVSENIDLYLVLGQSNASGRCPWLCFRDFKGEYSGELQDVYLLNEKDEFENAANSFARYSTVEKYVFNSGLGVPWSFAKEIINSTNNKLGFISNARGGVETEQWFPDYVLGPDERYDESSIGYTPGNNLYQEAKKRFDAVKLKYPNAALKGVIWMQGESDALKINTNNYDYKTRTEELIQHFRNDYNSPNLKFLMTEVSYKEYDYPNNDWSHVNLNQELHQIAMDDPNVILANVNGLETFDQINVHWKIESYEKLGVRLANLLLQNETCTEYIYDATPQSSNYINNGCWNDPNTINTKTTDSHNKPQINSNQAWSAKDSSQNNYVGMMFSGPSGIIGVSTKGRADMDQWVTDYKLEGTRDNGTNWLDLGTYSANSDRNTTVYNTLNNTDNDWTGLRIVPISWVGHPSLRFEFTLCSPSTQNKNGNTDTKGRFDGDSEINLITFKNASVYPNPAKDVFNLSFHAEQEGKYTFKIIDMHGRILDSDDVEVESSGQQLFVYKQNGILKSGTYLIILSGREKSQTFKLIIN